MVQDKKEKSRISETTSSGLGITTTRQRNLNARCVACPTGFAWKANHHVPFQHGIHGALHGGGSSVLGVGVHGGKEGGEVEAGVLEIEMAEDACKG